MAGGSGTGGRRAGSRVPYPSTAAAAAALRAKRAAAATAAAAAAEEPDEALGPRAIPPAPGRERDRGDFEDLDLTEPDDLELWIGEQLRDWQLAVGAETLGQLRVVCQRMLDQARAQREAVRNDLRQEGYLDGQINVLETIIEQVGRAVKARRDRIGERVQR